MGRKPKPKLPLPASKKDICPFGDSRCPICALPKEDIQRLHYLKFEKNWTYERLIDYLSETYRIGRDKAIIADHFLRHVNNSTQIEKSVKRKRVPKKPKTKHQTKMEKVVAQVVEYVPEDSKLATREDMGNAYEKLVRMTSGFTENVSKILGEYTVNPDKIKEKLDEMGPIDALEKLGKLLKENREQIAAVTALRRPKVVVAQFLEKVLDDIIYDTGGVLSDLAAEIQQEVMKMVNTRQTIDNTLFSKIFRETGSRFKEMMKSLKRENMQKALQALADLEKVI